jgi:hypothetical protein
MYSVYYHSNIELARYINKNELLFDIFCTEKSEAEIPFMKYCDLIRVFLRAVLFPKRF